MKLTTVLEFGLKLALAIGAGLAMFAGVNEAVKRNKVNENSDTGNCNDQAVNNKNTANSGSSKTSTVISGLRAAQSTCGKLFALTQGLATVAESISTLSNSSKLIDNNPGYYQGGGGGQRWRRVNPFILESVPSDAPIYYGGNQYPY